MKEATERSDRCFRPGAPHGVTLREHAWIFARPAMVVVGISMHLVAVLLHTTGCVHTPPFRDAHGRIIPESIASMETLRINGTPQSVWFRGRDTHLPILILLHGGPGISEGALFRHFNSGLENHFLVVTWEQRGAGRSYRRDIPPESMTVEQFDRDLDALVDIDARRWLPLQSSRGQSAESKRVATRRSRNQGVGSSWRKEVKGQVWRGPVAWRTPAA